MYRAVFEHCSVLFEVCILQTVELKLNVCPRYELLHSELQTSKGLSGTDRFVLWCYFQAGSLGNSWLVSLINHCSVSGRLSKTRSCLPLHILPMTP